MRWTKLLSTKRFGMENYYNQRKHDRTEYQRDYDRLIFSSPFRRLQNKTQVFPLPGSVFVHNRLTHSLEVASVGRSIGNYIGKALRKKYPEKEAHFEEVGDIVAAACLAHDLGNPPFGHSGEKAIGTFFSEGKGQELKDEVEKDGGRWHDFTHFEGNANAIRLLTHQFTGRRQGGFAMTYSTLAAIVKYPYSSELSDNKQKFGFFASEEKSYLKIAEDLGIRQINNKPLQFARYPLVYLVEAADDICYQIMDIEDAHKLNIQSTEKTIELLIQFFEGDRLESVKKNLNFVDDTNEKIAYLRSSIIGQLVQECAEVFLKNENKILKGSFEDSLIKKISPIPLKAYKECTSFAVSKIYRSKEVLDIELAGYHIIGSLLERFIDAIQTPSHAYSTILLNRVPEQYNMYAESITERVQAVIDFISGMTDVYALDLYRKITGMDVPLL
ncbi:MAG TPA: dNTP triphosphohydrolase [Dysgonamonadaceae bacterium]|nr:dNTP triphosphohydrolase [Dysgonamonadaceae bacterium]